MREMRVASKIHKGLGVVSRRRKEKWRANRRDAIMVDQTDCPSKKSSPLWQCRCVAGSNRREKKEVRKYHAGRASTL